MGQEPRISAGTPVEETLDTDRWSDRELAELHVAALSVGARASRLAAGWGAPPRPVLAPPAPPRLNPFRLIGRALTEVPLYLYDAFALCWPILVAVGLVSLRLGPTDPIPAELRRGVTFIVLALAVPIVLHTWMRQRGGRAEPTVLGTLLRIGPRELTAVLVFVALAAGSALIGAFLAGIVRALGGAPVFEGVAWVIAGVVFVQWSTILAVFAREDDRSPLAVQRALLRDLPALLLVALPLMALGLLAGVGVMGRVMSGPLDGAVDLRLIGWTALTLLFTLSYGSTLLYAVEATSRPR